MKPATVSLVQGEVISMRYQDSGGGNAPRNTPDPSVTSFARARRCALSGANSQKMFGRGVKEGNQGKGKRKGGKKKPKGLTRNNNLFRMEIRLKTPPSSSISSPTPQPLWEFCSHAIRRWRDGLVGVYGYITGKGVMVMTVLWLEKREILSRNTCTYLAEEIRRNS